MAQKSGPWNTSLLHSAGLGIDNAYVEVNGPEIPILDGSSIELTSLILNDGIAKQSKKRPYIRITSPIVLTDGHAEIAAFPYNGRRITYRIHFNHHLLGEQKLSLDLTEENFAMEIAPARTFGFLKDVEYLKANGFARGGSFDNAIILGENGILNASGLRFKDEFVRHKILDLIGDLSSVGIPDLRPHYRKQVRTYDKPEIPEKTPFAPGLLGDGVGSCPATELCRIPKITYLISISYKFYLNFSAE